MDYQINRRKNIFVFLTKGIGLDLALKVFLTEKVGGREGCFLEIDVYFFNIEMREIVFL